MPTMTQETGFGSVARAARTRGVLCDMSSVGESYGKEHWTSAQHGKELLVVVDNGAEAIWLVELQLRTCFAQAIPVLSGGEDGKIEDLACAGINELCVWRVSYCCVGWRRTGSQQLLRRGYDAGELMDGGAELVLQVADTVVASAGATDGPSVGVQERGVGCEIVSTALAGYGDGRAY